MGGKGAAEERMKRSELSATIPPVFACPRQNRLMNGRRRGIPRGSKFGEPTEKVAGIEWRNAIAAPPASNPAKLVINAWT